MPYPKLKHKLPAFWIHTVRFGSKMYVLDPTRAAIQALAPTVTGAGSKCHRTGLDTEGLPVTRTAVLLCTLSATVTRLLYYYSPCR